MDCLLGSNLLYSMAVYLELSVLTPSKHLFCDNHTNQDWFNNRLESNNIPYIYIRGGGGWILNYNLGSFGFSKCSIIRLVEKMLNSF